MSNCSACSCKKLKADPLHNTGEKNGNLFVGCQIENHIKRDKKVSVPKLLVDTGSEFTWISEKTLMEIDVSPEKKDVNFVMADGQLITRTVGFAVIRVNKKLTIDEVVFAKKGDAQLLGARTLEGLNLAINSKTKKLVAAGPIKAAKTD